MCRRTAPRLFKVLVKTALKLWRFSLKADCTEPVLLPIPIPFPDQKNLEYSWNRQCRLKRNFRVDFAGAGLDVFESSSNFKAQSLGIEQTAHNEQMRTLKHTLWYGDFRLIADNSVDNNSRYSMHKGKFFEPLQNFKPQREQAAGPVETSAETRVASRGSPLETA